MYVPVYWLSWCIDMPRQNSSSLQHPVWPAIHISTNDLAMFFQSYPGRRPGKE